MSLEAEGGEEEVMDKRPTTKKGGDEETAFSVEVMIH